MDFRKYLKEFCISLAKENAIPVRLHAHYLYKHEVEGECLDWLLQYLEFSVYLGYPTKRSRRLNFPFSLALNVARQTVDEILALDLTQFYDDHSFALEREPLLSAGYLGRAVFEKLADVCRKWQTAQPVICPHLESLDVSIYAVKNERPKMEDRHNSFTDIRPLFNLACDSPVSLFSVCDGHGGVEAAIYTATHLYCNLLQSPHFYTNMKQAFRESFRITDKNFEKRARKQGYRSGSTALMAVLMKQKLHVAWCGDSQLALIKNNQVIFLTEPHRPDRPDERKRIESQLGTVTYLGSWRVNGMLSVSRSIGDIDHKKYIPAEPEIFELDLDGSESYMVLACDGFWDTVSPSAAVDIVSEYLAASNNNKSSVAEKLVEAAKEAGSDDNITVIVVFFPPQLPEATDRQSRHSIKSKGLSAVGISIGGEKKKSPALLSSSPIPCKQQ